MDFPASRQENLSIAVVRASAPSFLRRSGSPKISTISDDNALPSAVRSSSHGAWFNPLVAIGVITAGVATDQARSEEHTSELQSHSDLVCRLVLEKKKHNIESC